MRLRTIPLGKLKGKRIVLREDLNVELTGRGKVADDTKLRLAAKTVNAYRRVAQSVIILSHLGRPAARDRARWSLRPAARRLAAILKAPVEFMADGPTRETDITVSRLPNGSVVLLENTRFQAGEKRNDRALAKRYASLGDLFIMDAFASAHRAHASTVGITHFLPSYAGPRLAKEVSALSRAIIRPAHPYLAILGGAKVSTKIGLLKKLLEQADYICVGGAIANTLLRAKGLATGASLVEDAVVKSVRHLPLTSVKLKLPVDVVVSTRRLRHRKHWVRPVGNISPDEFILDIGPDTIELFRQVITSSKLIVWNGPLGLFEESAYSKGTFAIAKLVAQAKAETIVGGGETVQAIDEKKLNARITHLSTAGGAMLEFLEMGTLPALIPLKK